jgi:hypothetical protein
MQSNAELILPARPAWNFPRLPRLRFCLLWMALFWILGNHVYSHTWYSPEMRARVTTPDGTPIEGAIVVASWQLRYGVHGQILGQLEVVEAITDSRGKFTIPAWGPRYVSPGGIEDSEPTIRIFHRQFVPSILRNIDDVSMHTSPKVIRFRYQDQDIVLAPFTGALSDYEEISHEFFHSIDFIFSYWDKCYWAGMPNFLFRLQHLHDDLEKIGAAHHSIGIYKYALENPQLCREERKHFSWRPYE